MLPSFKAVVIAPSETDFGIARLVELTDGSGRVEVFDEASKSWKPSPKGLTVGDVSDGKPVSDALAARLGLSDLSPTDDEVASMEPKLKVFLGPGETDSGEVLRGVTLPDGSARGERWD